MSSFGSEKSNNFTLRRLQAKSEKIYFFLICAWILVCGFFYLKLSLNPVCDYDESYTVSMVSHSFREIVSITSQDVHSPLYYFLVKIFSLIPGLDYILASKLFSYVCTMLFLIWSAFAVRSRYGMGTAFDFVFIASVTPMMISQVCNARMYTAGLLFYFIALFEGYLLFESVKKKRVLAFILASVLTVYLHHVFMTMMVIVYLIFLLVSLIKKRYSLFRTYLLCGVVTGASFLPWFFVMLRQFKNRNETGSVMYSLSDFAWYKENLYAWKDELFSGTFYDYGWMIRFWMIAIVIMIPGLVLHIRRHRYDFLPVLGPIVMALTFLVPGILLLMYSGQFFARYAFPGYAGIWLYMAVSMSSRKNAPKLVKPVLGLVRIAVLGAALYFGVKTYEAQYNALDRSGIDAYVKCMDQVEDGDAVMFSDTWSSLLQIYDEDKDYWIYGYNPVGMPFYYKGVYTMSSQMDEYSRVWMVGNDTVEIANMGDDYAEIDRFEFDHQSYHFIVKLYKKS